MMGGGRGLIHSKVILVPQKIFSKIFNFWPNVWKVLSKCIPGLHKIRFLLHFHVCCFSNNRYEWIKFFLWCIYILSLKSTKQNNLDLDQKPHWIFLLFFAVDYKLWKSQSFVSVLLKMVLFKMAVCKVASS